MMILRSHVPCNGCRACCINDLILLDPEHGDDPAQYETQDVVNPITGQKGLALTHKPNGECTYLGPDGCTIHERAPAICRKFDCRKMFLKFSRTERRRLIKAGMADREKFDAGRKRLHTLEGA
jgi:Fe-S-cluster containining protein